MSRALHWTWGTECICLSLISGTLATHVDFLVEKLGGAIANFWRCYEEPPLAHELMKVQPWLQYLPFVVGQLQERSIWSFCTSGLSNGCSRPHFPTLFASVRLASSAFTEASIWCCKVLQIMPITQPGLSSSFSLACSASTSLWFLSSVFTVSSGLARSFRLSRIALNISSNVISAFLVVNPAFSAFLLSSSFGCIAVSACLHRFLATVVPLFTEASIYYSFSLSLTQCVSHCFTSASILLD